MKYEMVPLVYRAEHKDRMAEWFSTNWGISKEAYLESMNACLMKEDAIPQWYIVLDNDEIIAGLGVIKNDFHNRTDLTPNICAIYVEEQYRSQGIAGYMLNFVCKDMMSRGINTLYLVTDHTSYYERYGWEHLCMVQCDGETDMKRMYIHREQ